MKKSTNTTVVTKVSMWNEVAVLGKELQIYKILKYFEASEMATFQDLTKPLLPTALLYLHHVFAGDSYGIRSHNYMSPWIRMDRISHCPICNKKSIFFF